MRIWGNIRTHLAAYSWPTSSFYDPSDLVALRKSRVKGLGLFSLGSFVGAVGSVADLAGTTPFALAGALKSATQTSCSAIHIAVAVTRVRSALVTFSDSIFESIWSSEVEFEDDKGRADGTL